MDERQRPRERGELPARRGARLPDRLLWIWEHGDPISIITPPFVVQVERISSNSDLARAAALPPSEVEARRRRGNRPYVGRIDGEIAAYGWACYGTAECGSRNLPFLVRDGDCYLWDFATAPRWRGNGLYPYLLTRILRDDDRICRYWIMHNQNNEASRRGIARAGFRVAAALYDLPDGRFGMEALADIAIARLVRETFAEFLSPSTRGQNAA